MSYHRRASVPKPPKLWQGHPVRIAHWSCYLGETEGRPNGFSFVKLHFYRPPGKEAHVQAVIKFHDGFVQGVSMPIADYEFMVGVLRIPTTDKMGDMSVSHVGELREDFPRHVRNHKCPASEDTLASEVPSTSCLSDIGVIDSDKKDRV